MSNTSKATDRTKSPNKEFKKPVKKFTFLKFIEKDGRMISFISEEKGKGGSFFRGVKESFTGKKSVAVVDSALTGTIKEGVLYRCAIVHMKGKSGYIVTEATQHMFPVDIMTEFVKKVFYKIEIKIGSRKITFDPLLKFESHNHKKTIASTIEVISGENIKDVNGTVSEFKRQAYDMINQMRVDGYYVKA